MSEPKEPTPVRAWVERAAWSQYLQWDEKAGRFIRVSVPTGGDRELGVNWQGYRSIPDAISEGAWGPIHSLRVLFDGGLYLTMMRCDPGPGRWFWDIHNDEDYLHSGDLRADSDDEAVTTALADAVRWIAAQEEER